MSAPVLTIRVGRVQAEALGVYVLGTDHELEPFPGRLVGDLLEVNDREGAYDVLTQGANSADSDSWPQFRDALQAVARRVIQ